jgi:hypothetical protein
VVKRGGAERVCVSGRVWVTEFHGAGEQEDGESGDVDDREGGLGSMGLTNGRKEDVCGEWTRRVKEGLL